MYNQTIKVIVHKVLHMTIDTINYKKKKKDGVGMKHNVKQQHTYTT